MEQCHATNSVTEKGCRILELSYSGYTDKKRDELYQEILNGLGK
jgi:hypothetical protein